MRSKHVNIFVNLTLSNFLVKSPNSPVQWRVRSMSNVATGQSLDFVTELETLLPFHFKVLKTKMVLEVVIFLFTEYFSH